MTVVHTKIPGVHCACGKFSVIIFIRWLSVRGEEVVGKIPSASARENVQVRNIREMYKILARGYEKCTVEMYCSGHECTTNVQKLCSKN